MKQLGQSHPSES